LENLDFYSIKLKFFQKAKKLLENPSNILLNEKKVSFDILEFKDGIYSIKKDKFIKNAKEYSKIEDNLVTLKYYNISYKHCVKKKPIN